MYLAPKGFSREIDGWGVETKADTFTCKHCQRVTEVFARADPNEFWCTSCMAPICLECKKRDWNRPAGAACSHFERRLEYAEARGRFWEQLDQRW